MVWIRQSDTGNPEERRVYDRVIGQLSDRVGNWLSDRVSSQLSEQVNSQIIEWSNWVGRITWGDANVVGDRVTE
jgi:hypothetical protein